MFGAICGDVIGSVYEFSNVKRTDFELFTERSRFTDDSVCTVAIAESIPRGGTSFEMSLRSWGRQYPDVSYGSHFKYWLRYSNMGSYFSWGNGSAMRVSPVAYASEKEDEVMLLAEASAEVTHDHPFGIQGAQAVALAIFLARKGYRRHSISNAIETQIGYDLSASLDDIRPNYKFDVSCQGSVPQAIRAFLESENFEDCIRKAISIGGDSDTISAISASIAEAYYKGVPEHIEREVMKRLPDDMKLIISRFREEFIKW